MPTNHALPGDVVLLPPLMAASRPIEEKHAALGGNGGPLGPPVQDLALCPDGQGCFRRYRHGMIYWHRQTGAHEIHGAILDKWSRLGFERSLLGYPVTDETGTPDGVGRFNRFQHGMIYCSPWTGAHEIHGAILDKWSSLGYERSLLGYPVTDETGTPDGVGRFNRFQNGMIYWTPQTAAHEIHGDILLKWQELGYERSYLGYPVSDELDYDTMGGRASFFQRGGIYWWPDVGPVDLRDVVVHYTGLVCFSETAWDQGSDSDEPYAVIGVTSPDGSAGFRSRIYDDVDGRESRPDLMEVYRGKPKGLALSTVLMEHDDDDPNRYKAAMETALGQAATGVRGLLTLIPVAGPVLATAAGPLLDKVVPIVAQALSDLLDLKDDKIGEATLAISAKEMVVLAARTANSNERGVGYKLVTPMLTGGGAAYKVYFGIVPA